MTKINYWRVFGSPGPDPVMACHDADALPTLPDVELGLARHPRTEGDPLIDAVETALRRMI